MGWNKRRTNAPASVVLSNFRRLLFFGFSFLWNIFPVSLLIESPHKGTKLAYAYSILLGHFDD